MRVGILGNRMYECAAGRRQREQMVSASGNGRDSACVSVLEKKRK
jgi:hypothetical protein